MKPTRPRETGIGALALLVATLSGACDTAPYPPVDDKTVIVIGPQPNDAAADVAAPAPDATYDPRCNCGIVDWPATPPQSCVFSVPCRESDFFRLELRTATGGIPSDATHTNGWDFTDESWLTVEVYGPICTDIMTGAATVTIGYGC